MKLVRTLLMLVAVGVVGAPVHAQNDSKIIGNWKLNVAKSTYSPEPKPKSETRTYEAMDNDGVKATYTTVTASGLTTTRSRGFEAHYDGKDYEYLGSPDFDTIALKRVSTTITTATLKRRGRVQQTARVVVSNSGKTLTVTVTGKNAKGQRVNNVLVFDRQ